MSHQYVTTDKSGLREFRGTGTNREVLVNGDPEDRIVLLREPSKDEVKEAIKEYYSLRIAHWWDNSIMPVCTDQKQSKHPLLNAPFASGFRAYVCHVGRRKKTEFCYLRTPRLKQHLPESPRIGFVDFCVTLPLSDQLALLEAIRPATVEDLHEVVHLKIIPNVLPQLNLLECLEQSDSVLAFIDKLARLVQTEEGASLRTYAGNWKTPGLVRLLELLGWFNQKKWMLFNKKALLSLCNERALKHQWHLSDFLGHRTYWNAESVELAEVIKEECKQTGRAKLRQSRLTGAYNRLCLLLRSSTVETVGDFSPELLTFNERYLELALSNDTTRTARLLTDAVVRTYRKDPRYAHNVFPVVRRIRIGRDDIGKPKDLRRSRTFRWALKDNPQFVQWVELFEEYTNQAKVQWGERFFSSLNRWLDYLAGLEAPPMNPEEVDRAKHIRNVCDQSVNTYWKFLEAQVDGPNHRNSALARLRRFFDYYQDKLISEYKGLSAQSPLFPNPVKSDDKWNPVVRKGKTERYALPTDLLELLREILLDRDRDGKPTFNWAKNHPTFYQDWTYEVDPETKETVKVWWPGRAIALYVLLTVPLRSFQVRWLDEGLGDEYVYDFDEGRMIANPHPYAEAGRQEGVFRLISDAFTGQSFLGLWVNTNKTKLYSPTAVHGYQLPWPNDELFLVLRMMQDWNSKYFPNPTPVTFADDPQTVPTEAVKPYLKKFYPLFRDKKSDRQNHNLPINYEKLARMWGVLLLEAENRLKEQGRQIKLAEVVSATSSKGYPYKVPKAIYDLHSLRVSGVTSLIEKGVPVHIISEYVVGHSAITMTLYYEKTPFHKIREHLLRAQDKAESDLDGCLTLLDIIDDPESILVSNKFDYAGDAAFQALEANKGLWQADFAGICPGTLCEEGGPPDVNGKGTPVPTGACGLCRFYITGPAFLYGQMQKLNNLMYSMREKGAELRDLRVQVIDLKDGGSKRGLAKARSRCERIERELKDALREWCNRYRMFQASLAMLDEYQERKRTHAGGDKSLIPLLSANTQDGFKAVVAEATNVGLVRQISLMHEVLGNFDLHKGPLLEYEEILNRILVNNGFEALLLTIPKEKRVAAANLLGEFLIDSIGGDAIDKLSVGGGEMPEPLRVQARGLIEYLKSDRFVINSPARSSAGRIPQQYVQTKGLKA